MDFEGDISSLAGPPLPNLGDYRSRYRSLAELKAASASLGGGTSVPVGSSFSHSPYLHDLPHLLRASHSLRSSAAPRKDESKNEPRHFRTPDERCQDHLQRIMDGILEREYDATRSKLDEIFEERRKENHKEFITKWQSEVKGNRTLGGASHLPEPSPANAASTSSDLDPNMVGAHLQIVHQWNRHPQVPIQAIVQSFKDTTNTEVWRFLEKPPTVQGSLAYYSEQYLEIIQQRVRQAHAAGQDITPTYPHLKGIASTVAAYVKLTTTTQSLWPIVFYCLRCGDAVAAHHAMQIESSPDPTVLQVLQALSQVQGSAPSLWEAPTPPIIPNRQSVTDIYLRAKATGTDDAYHVACLALLSANEPYLDSPIVVKTMEDYMFGWLWYALQQSALAEVGQTLHELGPSNFPDHTWGYALPLLAAQQYRSALTHLARNHAPHGLLHATHVAMVLYKLRIELEDYGKPSGSCLLTSLLVEYATKLQSKDALAALEYLVRIPSTKRVATEVARLAVETQQYDPLAGPLSELFSKEQLSPILVEAAEQARVKGNQEDAAKLLFRAGQYDSLLSLMSYMLATELVTQTGSETNTYWRTHAQGFHAAFLANGQDSDVVRFLRDKGQEGHRLTLELLMDLNKFLELVQSEQHERAWGVMDRLPLLPISESDCSSKARHYQSLDPSVKKVIPLVLEKAMESLSKSFGRLKSSSYAGSSSAELQRLQGRARVLLFSFVNMLRPEIPSDVLLRMTRMERSMM